MKLELKLRRNSPTKEELIKELKRVAKRLKKNNFTQDEFNKVSKFQSFHYKRKFKTDEQGGWNNALVLAKLVVKKKINIPIKTLMDNLYDVWKRKGSQVTRDDMENPVFKSKHSSAVYRRRFGGWPNTLRFFVKYNSSKESILKELQKLKHLNKKNIKSQTRTLTAQLKLEVLQRTGGYICKNCDRSKIDYPKLKFEFDHIKPVSKSGTNELKNIQILCYDCNRLKSDKLVRIKK